MVRVLRGLLASMLLVFSFAGLASANSLGQDVPPGGIDPVDFEGSTTECADANVGDGQVLWHFVHPTTDSEDIPAFITVTFLNENGEEVILEAGYVVGESPVMYNVYTPQGWTLLGAEDTATGDGTRADQLLLSHTCFGGPPPEIPEAPFALLLPLVALGTVGGGLLLNRRRASSLV